MPFSLFSLAQLPAPLAQLPAPLLAALALLPLLLAAAALCRGARAPALSASFAAFKVKSVAVANHGARPVVFITLPVSTAALPTGAHVKVRALINGEETTRSYTPTRFHAGECELMVRVYKDGPMSTHLAALRPGDSLRMMGPTGLERSGARGPGSFSRGERAWEGMRHVGLISGGTGITPMLQIANHVLQDPADATRLSLVSFTSSVEDIALEDTLLALAAGSAGALRVTFAASAASAAELAARPHARKASMRSLSPAGLAALLGLPPGARTMGCGCGPDGFVLAAKKLLAPAFENVIVW